ncbi:MAG: hypothetical protein Q8P08_00970 [bacterium]|nr:hypothetical protein [bacterium]
MEDEYVDELDPEVEEAIREAAAGDSDKEKGLRESAKRSSVLRFSLKHPGQPTLTSSGPDFSKIFDKSEQKKPPR